jgi:glycerol-3-phosphate acyltransferase PlsY
MDTATHVISMLIFGYLLGSIPFAKLFTMRAGIDLFETGTGNPGAANVFRRVPVLIAWLLGAPEEIWFVGGAAAIVGHWYPLFNRFKGGAGLAAGAGTVVALMPLGGIVGLILGMAVIAKVKSSGHGALTGVIVIVLVSWLVDADWPIGAEWPAMAAAVGISAVLFAKALARGWKPGRKD